jgi:hypothetical protein
MTLRILALALCLSVATPVVAQDAGVPAAMRLPWHDRAPELDTVRGVVSCVALGVADERRGPLTARRLWARRDAEARARAALHAWVDAAVSRSALDSGHTAAVHRVIDEQSQVTVTRARVDGSACVEIVVPLHDLAAATPGARGLPWSA